MAKANNKGKIVWYLVGGGALFAGALYATAPSDAPPVAKKPDAVRKSAVLTGDDQLTDADYNAKFQHVIIVSPKDVFKPVVYRQTGGKSSNDANAIPSQDTGGDANWTFNGTGEDNGVMQALFQNSTTGDGVFVTRGQHWKQLVVEEVTADSCTISGPTGKKKLVPVLTEATPAGVAANAAVVAPVNPPVTGAIGADAAAAGAPDASGGDAAGAMLQGLGGMGMGGGRRGRGGGGRGGRGRGGGGFGGGGFGGGG